MNKTGIDFFLFLEDDGYGYEVCSNKSQIYCLRAPSRTLTSKFPYNVLQKTIFLQKNRLFIIK